MANKYPTPFSKMAKSYRKFRGELTLVASNIAENEFTGNFGRNSVGGYRDRGAFHAWQKRKKLKGKPTSRRSVLVKTGRLRRSFQKRPTVNYARVVNTAPYAAIHNEGGKITGTQQVRAFTRKNKQKVKAHSRKVNTTMPKRPFMITNTEIIQQIDKHVDDQLTKIFKQP